MLGETSVSGLSAGAYMAGQLQVAHSKQIVGAGIVAGGPFGCAEGQANSFLPSIAKNLSQAFEDCLNGEAAFPMLLPRWSGPKAWPRLVELIHLPTSARRGSIYSLVARIRSSP